MLRNIDKDYIKIHTEFAQNLKCKGSKHSAGFPHQLQYSFEDCFETFNTEGPHELLTLECDRDINTNSFPIDS